MKMTSCGFRTITGDSAGHVRDGMALFREYDLRGIVGEELTEPIAEQVGRAHATMARGARGPRISVGGMAPSSPALQQALLQGLSFGGLDVVDLGLCASPLLFFPCSRFRSTAES